MFCKKATSLSSSTCNPIFSTSGSCFITTFGIYGAASVSGSWITNFSIKGLWNEYAICSHFLWSISHLVRSLLRNKLAYPYLMRLLLPVLLCSRHYLLLLVEIQFRFSRGLSSDNSCKYNLRLHYLQLLFTNKFHFSVF